MLDFSSSRTMNFNYLHMEPSLRMDDLDLLDKFEGYIFFHQDFDDNILAKVEKREMEFDAFVRILHIMQTQFHASKCSSSFKSSHDSSRNHSF